MVDFFYHGEANVFQQNLDTFLALAEELQLKGLRGNQAENEASSEVFSAPAKRKDPSKLTKAKAVMKQNPQNFMSRDVPKAKGIVQPTLETAVALPDHTSNNTDLGNLKQQVKSMMISSDNADPYKNGARAKICKVYGKEGSWTNIMQHIEAKHITGITIPCDLCGKSFKSRNSLASHTVSFNRNDQ